MNWKTYLKKKGARVGAIVVAVVLVLALIAGALGGKAGFLTNLDGIVRAPLQKAATVTAQWLESIYGYIYKYDQLKAENEQLRTRLAEAQAQAREGQEAIAENERYRDLLHNVETAEVFAKSQVKVWECRNCGHIVVGEKAPEVCPTCNHPQSYFEVRAENY